MNIGLDQNRKPIANSIGSKAQAVTVDASVSTATDITLDIDTKLVRIFSKAQGLFVRSQATASSANWDWFCPADQFIDIRVPDDVTVISVIEETAGATAIIAEY